MTHKFLIHKRGDHVGVAVCDIEGGERVEMVEPGGYVHTHNLRSARW